MLDDGSFWLLTGFSEGPSWAKLSPLVASDIYNPYQPGSGSDVGAQLDFLFFEKANLFLAVRDHVLLSDTLSIEDAGHLITSTYATAVTEVIPANADVPFPVGTVIQIAQLGAGQVSLSIVTDTLRVPPGFVAKLRGQYSTATITKIAETTWLASGDLAFV